MQSPYLAVKHLHIASVALSITLFMVRAGWMLYSPERLQRRWVKVIPHVNDTMLLLSGAWLAWQIGAPGLGGWLPAKLVALLLYIALGAVALRYGRTRGVRTAAMISALVTFAYIVSVALVKSPLGALASSG